MEQRKNCSPMAARDGTTAEEHQKAVRSLRMRERMDLPASLNIHT